LTSPFLTKLGPCFCARFAPWPLGGLDSRPDTLPLVVRPFDGVASALLAAMRPCWFGSCDRSCGWAGIEGLAASFSPLGLEYMHPSLSSFDWAVPSLVSGLGLCCTGCSLLPTPRWTALLLKFLADHHLLVFPVACPFLAGESSGLDAYADTRRRPNQGLCRLPGTATPSPLGHVQPCGGLIRFRHSVFGERTLSLSLADGNRLLSSRPQTLCVASDAGFLIWTWAFLISVPICTLPNEPLHCGIPDPKKKKQTFSGEKFLLFFILTSSLIIAPQRLYSLQRHENSSIPFRPVNDGLAITRKNPPINLASPGKTNLEDGLMPFTQLG